MTTDFNSPFLDKIERNEHSLELPNIKICVAEAFGFCYGVARAVQLAVQATRDYPNHRLFLTAEIIHNPFVNSYLRQKGVAMLSGPQSCGLTFKDLTQNDVVIVPAFGLPVEQMTRLKQTGCTIIDTTCGSVMNVWRRVEHYARNGFTCVIHGKRDHEETVTTISHATAINKGKFLVVRSLAEAEDLASIIRNNLSREQFKERFGASASDDLDPQTDLMRIGLANQTTMLSSESEAIAEIVRSSLVDRYGHEEINNHFMNFETICSATQKRQDAVIKLASSRPDLMLVIGGFNSSNTGHLCDIASQYCPTYHIDSPECLIDHNSIRCKPTGSANTVIQQGWLPDKPNKQIGITAGASTPRIIIADVIQRLLALSGYNSFSI